MIIDSAVEVDITVETLEFGLANVSHSASEQLCQILGNILHSFEVADLILQIKDLIQLYLAHLADLGGHI